MRPVAAALHETCHARYTKKVTLSRDPAEEAS